MALVDLISDFHASEIIHLQERARFLRKCGQPSVRLGSCPEYDCLPVGVFPEKRVEDRTVVPAVVPDHFHELRVKAVFHPWDIGTALADTFRDSLHALVFAVIEEDDRVAAADPDLVCPAVVAVDDPALAFEDFGKPAVELVAGNVGAVLLPPDVVQMEQGETGAFVEPG